MGFRPQVPRPFLFLLFYFLCVCCCLCGYLPLVLLLTQLNDNKLANLERCRCLQQLPALETLYLERNPLQANLGPGYRQAVTDLLPRKPSSALDWVVEIKLQNEG